MTKKVNVKEEQLDYGFYSKLLNKPFNTVTELKEAEATYYAEQQAKADKAAAKKADAQRVEDAFKALNQARKDYKEDLTQLTTEYTEALTELKQAFDLGKKDIQEKLAAAEDNYAKELKAFTEAHPEGYHVTLKDGDFETTISHQTSKASNLKKEDTNLLSLFDMLFGF
jgi:chromosome segregation ATPase